jgi:hypothetical protein
MDDLHYTEMKRRENEYKADQAIRGLRSAISNLAEATSNPETRDFILREYLQVAEAERELFLISHYLRGREAA